MNNDIETGKRLINDFTKANNNMEFEKAQEIIEIIINEDFNGGIKLPLYKTLASKYYWYYKNGKSVSIKEIDTLINELLVTIKAQEEFKLNPILQFYYWVYHTLLLIRKDLDANTVNFRSSILQLEYVRQMNEKIFNIKNKGRFLSLLNEEIGNGRKILPFDLNPSYSFNDN